MTLSLVERSNAEVQHALVVSLQGLGGPTALRRTLASEHIRALTHFGSTHVRAAGTIQLAHTTRLMMGLRKNLAGLWPPEVEDVQAGASETNAEDGYRSILDDLARIGDLVDTGGGFWMSAPLRLVDSDEPERLLVLGGAPREIVRTMLGAQPECVAASRFVRRANLYPTPAVADLVQSLDTWLGSADPLRSWTQRTIALYLQRLSQVEEIAADQVEIYAPDFYRDIRKLGRWMPANEVNRPIDDVRLFRPRLSHARAYDRPHYLGTFDFRQGKLVLRRSVQVDYQTSRRLRFGLDQALGTPRSASLSANGSTCVLGLGYALPEPEARVLSLGWQTAPLRLQGDQRTFHHAAWPLLVQALQRLSIEPTVTSRGTAA